MTQKARFTDQTAGKVVAAHRDFPREPFVYIVSQRGKTKREVAAGFRLLYPDELTKFEKLWAALPDVERLLVEGAKYAEQHPEKKA